MFLSFRSRSNGGCHDRHTPSPLRLTAPSCRTTDLCVQAYQDHRRALAAGSV